MFDLFKKRVGSDSPKEGRSKISRAQFLRGDLRGRERPLRPPWALAEIDFVEVCDGCGHCIEQCRPGILQPARGRLPVVDFGRGECTFCRACVDHCQPGALSLGEEENQRPPWSLELHLGPACVAQQGVVCQICKEQCGEQVFTFKPRIGGTYQMVIASERCSGCGACIAPCPVGALTLRHHSETSEEG